MVLASSLDIVNGGGWWVVEKGGREEKVTGERERGILPSESPADRKADLAGGHESNCVSSG